MTHDLHARLHDLATEAPAPEPAAADDLWRAGRRRQRRRTTAAGLAALALCAGLGSVGLALPGTGWTDSPPPAASVNGPHLPDRLYPVSPWLPTTDEKGPIGPLALVITGQEEKDVLGGADPAYVGVSAETGEYRFLSLPDLTPPGDAYWGDELALNADGTKIAYWYGNEPAREEGFGARAKGIAVYNTVTGDVLQHPITAPHGIQGEKPLWVGDRVWVSWFETVKDDPSAGISGGTRSWDPENDRMQKLPEGVYAPGDSGSVAKQRALVSNEEGYSLVDGKGAHPLRIRVDGEWDGPLVVSRSGDHVAARQDADGDPSTSTSDPAPILHGDLRIDAMLLPLLPEPPPGSASVTLAEVPDSMGLTAVGWRDGEHLVAVEPPPGGLLPRAFQYLTVDVETGERQPLVAAASGVGGGNYLFAGDAWTWPTTDAAEPEAPRDPRVLLGGGLVVVLLAGAASYALWRRRVRG